MEISTVVSFFVFGVLPGWSLLRLVSRGWNLDWIEWSVLSIIISVCLSTFSLFLLYSVGVPLDRRYLYIVMALFIFLLEAIRRFRQIFVERVDK